MYNLESRLFSQQLWTYKFHVNYAFFFNKGNQKNLSAKITWSKSKWWNHCVTHSLFSVYVLVHLLINYDRNFLLWILSQLKGKFFFWTELRISKLYEPLRCVLDYVWPFGSFTSCNLEKLCFLQGCIVLVTILGRAVMVTWYRISMQITQIVEYLYYKNCSENYTDNDSNSNKNNKLRKSSNSPPTASFENVRHSTNNHSLLVFVIIQKVRRSVCYFGPLEKNMRGPLQRSYIAHHICFI